MNRMNIFGKSVTYAFLIVSSLAFIIPFIWMVSTSLKEPGAIFVFPPEWIPEHFIFHNYKAAWTVAPFNLFLKNTVIIVVLTTLGTVISSSIVAFGFARLVFKGRNVWFAILLASMMIPYEVTLIPLYVEFKMLGWIDTLRCLIIPSFFGSAFNIFLLRQYFLTIPYELDEAAIIDGCSTFKVYWRILLPIVSPALVTVAIFQVMHAWTDFMGPLIFLNDQRNYTITLGLNLFRNSYLTEWNNLMAIASLVTVVPLVIFFIGQKYLIGGIAASGIKG
ncbi:carbohydrate ABC transporter permease [Paenibacillus andongensis]|uniref:carbohydrate ABC transporter permease n=1 Tax=Paenibacillus andongensis TaxID=2975482 RepID=UPI0021BB01EB|nr:carbohydrate ABC transporter permease [Paenibacillus andongensis]